MRTGRHGLTWLLLTLMTVSPVLFGQSSDSSGPDTKKSASHSKESATEIRDLRERVNVQQEQLDSQRQELNQLKDQLQQVLSGVQRANAAAADAQGKIGAVASESAKQGQAVQALSSTVSAVKKQSDTTASTVVQTQKNVTELQSPIAIHYRGINITPGGFLSADGVWRRAALGSDMATPLNAIPFDGSSATRLSETEISGRSSRLSLLMDGGLLRTTRLSGYVESDFNTAAITSNNNTTSSYALRLRQGFGQVAFANGWTITGGQQWDLIIENRNGADNRTELVPMTIDNSLNAGSSNGRQPGIRAVKDFGNLFWVAFSAENAQATITAHGNNQNFLLGSAGTSAGSNNPAATYSFNEAPDFVAKTVFQPRMVHIEVFGMVSTFRDRLFPNAALTKPNVLGARDNTSVGTALGASARVSLIHKHLDLGARLFGGTGIGRYGTSGLPDLTVRPDGVLVPIRNYQNLYTVELRTKKLDVYAYAGGEYAQRTAFILAKKGEGYGSRLLSNAGCSTETLPGTPVAGQFPTSTSGFLAGALSNCTGDTRDVLEGSFGWWYRFYKGPKGTFQWGTQLSYVDRNAWSGVGGAPNAVEPLVYNSFRYVLP